MPLVARTTAGYQLYTLYILATCLWYTHAAIPLIIDTDIGSDFDDAWAVALALSDPAYDVKMIMTASHDTYAKAQTVARYLDAYGRTDIPVAIGIKQDNITGPNPIWKLWGQYYKLSEYPGTVYYDGIKAAVALIEKQYAEGDPITILGIAPKVNMGHIASNYSHVVPKVKHVYSMFADINNCSTKNPGRCPEYNAAECPTCSMQYLKGGWNGGGPTIAPLDTCIYSHLFGDHWKALRAANNSNHPILHTLLTTFALTDPKGVPSGTADLCDTCAYFLSLHTAAFKIQHMNLTMEYHPDPPKNPWYTVPVTGGRGGPVNAAVWFLPNDEVGPPKMADHFVQILTSYTHRHRD